MNSVNINLNYGSVHNSCSIHRPIQYTISTNHAVDAVWTPSLFTYLGCLSHAVWCLYIMTMINREQYSVVQTLYRIKLHWRNWYCVQKTHDDHKMWNIRGCLESPRVPFWLIFASQQSLQSVLWQVSSAAPPYRNVQKSYIHTLAYTIHNY